MSQKKFIQELVRKGIESAMEDGGFSPSKIQEAMVDKWVDVVDEYIPSFAAEAKEYILAEVRKKGSGVQTIKVIRPETVQSMSLGLCHKQFTNVLEIVNNGMAILMVGMPGVGKTYAAEKMSEALKIPFHAISVGMQTTKSDIMGFMSANGEYVSTPFRKAFEKGGIFLMDEIDAGNPNVLIQINSAISNGFVEFPDKMVRAHKDFRFIGTANTYGSGIDSKFVGRNQLDSATLDRFVVIDWEVDEDLESAIIGNEVVSTFIRECREVAQDNEMEIIISTRSGSFLQKLLSLGNSVDKAVSMAVFRGVSVDNRQLFNNNVKWLESNYERGEIKLSVIEE